MKIILNKLCATLFIMVSVFVLASSLIFGLGVEPFELPYVANLFGTIGAGYSLFFTLICVYLFNHAIKTLKSQTKHPIRVPITIKIAISLLVLQLIFSIDWIFLERPLTFRLLSNLSSFFATTHKTYDATTSALRPNASIFNTNSARNKHADKSLALMLERIKINRPRNYIDSPIQTTIRKYATKYQIDPLLLFYWLYLDSFYGDAVSGPLPFFRGMTSETFRDLVQSHLPPWFIESPLRISLIENNYLEYIFGPQMGRKLRYALQKATYDISVEPYDVNIFSDVFLVMEAYESEFANPAARGIEKVMLDSFNILKSRVFYGTCGEPYKPTRFSPLYYDTYRKQIITYARATFYLLIFDFDFSTKVQALLAKYYTAKYKDILGQHNWNEISRPKRLALISMLRDVYRPNIGKLSYNVYVLPEFNCSPFEFVSEEARSNLKSLLASNTIWRPRRYDYLWAGAAFKLRVLSEVWRTVMGSSFEGFPASDTVTANLPVVAWHSSN